MCRKKYSSPVKERAVVYIHDAAEVHHEIAADILAIHGLSGADTIDFLHVLGKATVLKIFKKGCTYLYRTCRLFNIGDVVANIKYVKAQATALIYVLYGKSAQFCTSFTAYRVTVWRYKTSSKKE